MSRPKGGIGRGLGALGLGTPVRPVTRSEAKTEEIYNNGSISLGSPANGAVFTPTSFSNQEITVRDGRKVGFTFIPTNAIAPNPWQPRKHLDPVVLEELASSIREHGLIQPPVVSYNPDYAENYPAGSEASTGDTSKERPARYLLVAGERRWQAAKLAGLTTIPVVIKETTPLQMLELALVENIQRADLNSLEEAHAYRQLVSEFGLTQEKVARRVGKSRVTVTNSLRLLSLPNAVIETINEGKITEGHARAILMLERLPEDQRLPAQLRLLREIISKGDRLMSVREAEEVARRTLRLHSVALLDNELQGLPRPETETKTNKIVDQETQALEQRLCETLGAKVALSRSKKGGKIVIQFFSDEELEGIFHRIIDSEI